MAQQKHADYESGKYDLNRRKKGKQNAKVAKRHQEKQRMLSLLPRTMLDSIN